MDIEQVQPKLEDTGYGTVIKNVKQFQAGSGDEQVQINQDGLFIGGTNFADAPISFSYDGIQTFNNKANGTGRIKFSYGGEETGQIWVDSALNIVHWADAKHYFQNIDGTVGFAEIGADGLLLGAATSIFFASGSTLTDTGATLELDRTLVVDGDVSLSTGKKFQVGSSPGVTFSNSNVGGIFAINCVGGLVTYFNEF